MKLPLTIFMAFLENLFCAATTAVAQTEPETFPHWAWAIFVVFIAAMLALDLGVFHKDDKPVPFREAAAWSVVWIALAGAAFGGIWAWHGAEKAQLFSAGYLLELALSIDNLFVFIIIFSFFKIPEKYQHRVLFWGIIGAVVFRALFIFGGVALVEKFEWILWIFGAFLIFTGIKLFFPEKKEKNLAQNPIVRFVTKVARFSPELNDHDFFFRKNGLLYASPLFIALVVIELSDILFAVDSVPAVLGVLPKTGISAEEKMFLAFTSNIFAILGLRSFFFALSGFMKMLRFLHYGLGVVLVFIGIKLVLAELPGEYEYEFSIAQSLSVLGVVFGVSILLSLIFPKKSPEKISPENVSENAGNVSGKKSKNDSRAGGFFRKIFRKNRVDFDAGVQADALPKNEAAVPEAAPAAATPWIGVDLDGTLAQYSGWRGLDHIGAPVPVMLARVKHWLAEGYCVKIFTARASEGEKGIAPVKKWLVENGLPELDVTNQKDFAMIEFWDDRAIQVVSGTGRPFLSPSIFGRPAAPILPDEIAGETFYLLKKTNPDLGDSCEKCSQ